MSSYARRLLKLIAVLGKRVLGRVDDTSPVADYSDAAESGKHPYIGGVPFP